ncbi:MAG: hypothetical protein HS103_07835 [Anaerolineales bacterium]|nr:hypothetical protein [Anaerolineales bacterium]
MAKGNRGLLPPDDERRLQQIAETETGTLRQRAQALLALNDGQTSGDAARRSRLSVNQINYVLRQYKRKGLDLFLTEDEPVEGQSPTTDPEPPSVPEIADTAITLEALCAPYRIDMAHARHVAACALQIFDATANIHRLPGSLRPLLEAAAIVHNIAYEIDQPNHHLRGRDILMAQPIQGFSDDERRILACTTSFHRKKVRPEAEPVYVELPPDLRRDALGLAAILRVGDGFDHSMTQTVTISEIAVTADEVTIELEGLNAAENAEQSMKKADLWARTFNVPVRISAAQPAPLSGEERAIFRLPALFPEVQSTMSLERAGRAFALHSVNRVEALLRRVVAGELSLLPSLDREVSRLGTALELAHLEGNLSSNDLLWLAESVGRAHILAVLAARGGALADDLNDEKLLTKANAWDVEAHKTVQGLDSARFATTARALRETIQSANQQQETSHVAYYVAAMLWERLAELRQTMEHGESVHDAVAKTRRLQDHLVAFRDLLGAESGQALDMLTPLENYLNEILITQAVMVAVEQDSAKPRRGRKPTTPRPPDTSIETMRSAQTARLSALADALPAVWTSVNSLIFRRILALAVANP